VAVNKTHSNKTNDNDVPQRKSAVFRAHDIMPPYEKKAQQKPGLEEKTKNTSRSAFDLTEKTVGEKPESAPAGEIDDTFLGQASETEPGPSGQNTVRQSQEKRSGAKKENRREPAEGGEQSEIPRFDLADEIMAEQRRLTATRRKAPSGQAEAGKDAPKAERVGHVAGQLQPGKSDRDRIIAEIVARDIERLCRGDIAM
jgi:hypothetical protein